MRFDTLPPALDQNPDPCAHDGAADKALATAKARAALLGATLIDIEGDGGQLQYIVTKWALTKAFDGLADVELLLTRMEGKAA